MPVIFTVRGGLSFRTLLVCVSLVAVASTQAQQQLLVEFEDGLTAEQGVRHCESYILTSRSAVNRTLILPSVEGEALALVETNESAEFWRKLPGVKRVSNDGKVSPREVTPDDPTFPEQWHLDLIDVPDAWAYTTGGVTPAGDTVVIAVIESNGFQLDHPDLATKYYRAPGEIPGDGIDNDGSGIADDVTGWNFKDNISTFEPNFHGVHVCASIGAETDNGLLSAGIDWGSRLMPIQVETIVQWTSAIQYLTALRAKYNDTDGAEGAYIVAMNMSFGANGTSCSEFPLLNEAMDRAGRAGILSIGAAGSDGNADVIEDLPTSCASDYLVMVTATDQQDILYTGVDVGFSPQSVDIASPGDNYPSTVYSYEGANSTTFSSTSGATPLVTGAVSLMYALDCELFAALAKRNPGEGAKAIKRAALAGVDQTEYLATRVSSGGRLNAAGAIEALLEESCVTGEFVVQFASGDQAKASFSTGDGTTVERTRTLSEAWGMYLYAMPGDDGNRSAAISLLEAQPGLLGLEQNFGMDLRSLFPDDAGWDAQDALREIRTPQAWQNVYGVDYPEPSDVVTAVFDQEFKLGVNDLADRLSQIPSETPGNGVDDDGNGYIDDYSGYNFTDQLASRFSSGNHGLGMTSLLVAPANDQKNIAGIDWAGSVLPLQGQTLAEWVEAANYISQLRETYDATGGSNGAYVVSYLTPQGGSRSLVGGPQAGVVESVLANLMESGILTVGAMPNDSTNLVSDFPASVIAPGLIRVGATDSIGQPLQPFPYDSIYAADITAPGSRVVYSVANRDTISMSGTSPASALVAGTIALMFQVPNRAYSDPEDLATQIATDLVESGSVGIAANETAALNADLATYRYSEQASGRQYCIVTAVYPTLLRGNESAEVRVVGEPGESCLVKMANSVGQIVLEIDVPTEVGAAELRLGEGTWRPGVYYVSALAGQRRGALRLVVAP